MNDHSRLDIEHHAVVAPFYDELVNDPRRVLSDRIFAELGRVVPDSGMTMLDLGAGTGHMTVRFGDRFSKAVLVDHSQAMLDEARKNTARLRAVVVIHCADVLEYLASSAERFDFVACVGVLHHLEPHEIAALLSRVRALLRRGALVLLGEPMAATRKEPTMISWWNRPSLHKLRRYRALAPTPDESPLDPDILKRAIEKSGLSPLVERRAWELFTRYDGRRLDRIAIPLFDMLFHKNGTVWFGLLHDASSNA